MVLQTDRKVFTGACWCIHHTTAGAAATQPEAELDAAALEGRRVEREGGACYTCCSGGLSAAFHAAQMCSPVYLAEGDAALSELSSHAWGVGWLHAAC